MSFPKNSTRFVDVAARMNRRVTPAELAAARWLERHGRVFLVDFGFDNLFDVQRATKRAQPKRPPRAVKAARERKRTAWGQYLADRLACRMTVIARDGLRCRICRRHGNDVGYQVHEIVPRSQGGSPTDPKNCVLVCRKDHEDLTRNRTELLILYPGSQADNRLEFWDLKGEVSYV